METGKSFFIRDLLGDLISCRESGTLPSKQHTHTHTHIYRHTYTITHIYINIYIYIYIKRTFLTVCFFFFGSTTDVGQGLPVPTCRLGFQ